VIGYGEAVVHAPGLPHGDADGDGLALGVGVGVAGLGETDGDGDGVPQVVGTYVTFRPEVIVPAVLHSN